MTRQTVVVALAAVLVFAVPALTQDEVYLQVTTPGLQRVSLAATPFARRPGSDAAAAASFAATLTRDLEQTAVLALLPADRMALVEVDPRNTKLTHQRWRAVGAQFLLEGTVAGAGAQFVCEARLWDLASGEVAYSRRLQSPAALATTVAHTLANEIVNLFTGRPGPFLSRIAFVSDRSGAKELWVMRWDGSEAQQLTSHRSIAIGPAWSPDGDHLAFTSFLAGQPGLYVLKPTAGTMKPLWESAGVNSSPSFSPDGRLIAFASGADGNTDIFVVPLEGGTAERLTSGRSIETQPAWSPNGRQIAFTSTAPGTPQIFVMDAEGTNVRRVTFEDRFADEAAWAPDGVRLAYTTLVDGRFQIAIFDIRTGARAVVPGPGSNESPCWSPDGTMLAFSSNRTGSKQIYVTDPTGAARAVTDTGNNAQPVWVAQLPSR